MKPFVLLLSLLLTGVHAGQAQSLLHLSGGVKDTAGMPVTAVNVVLLDTNNQPVRTGYTDDTGAYHLEADTGTYVLKVIGYGYELAVLTDLVLHKDTILPDIVLAGKIIGLQEVTVRAVRPLIEVSADKVIMHVANTILDAGASVMDLLQRAPGVQVSGDQISLKGKQGVMIWINGKPAPAVGSDLANILRSMPSGSIEKIELISNPGAGLDAAGTAGIINIVLRKDQRMGINGSITAFYGQGVYPKYGTGANLNFRNKRWNVFTSYNYNMRYWFNHLMLDRRFLDTTSNGNSHMLRFDQDNQAVYDFNNHIAYASVGYTLTTQTTLGVTISGAANMFNPHSDNHASALDAVDKLLYNFDTHGRHQNRYYNYAAGLYMRHQFDSAGRQLSADMDYALFGNNSRQQFMTRYTAADGSLYLPDYYLKSRLTGSTAIYSLKASYIHPVTSRLKLEAGVKSGYVIADNNPIFYEAVNGVYRIDTGRSNHFIYYEHINAAYLHIHLDRKKWNAQLGLRAENTLAVWEQQTTKQRYDTAYVQLFPSLALQYNLHKLHTIGINLSRRIERPNYQQLNPFKYFIDKTIYSEGNPYLKPASFYATSLTHTFRQQFVTSLTLGINKGIITEVIQPSEHDTGSVTVQTYKNLDQMLFAGISGHYSFSVRPWWQHVTGFNVYYTRYRGNLANTPLNNGRPTFDINTNNTFLLPWRCTAELGLVYQASKLYGYMDVQPVWMLHAGIQQHFFYKKASLRLYVQDLFYTGYPRATSQYSGYREAFVAMRETRVVQLSFTYHLGNKIAPSQRHRGGAEEEKQRASGIGV